MSISYYSAIGPDNPPHSIEAPTARKDELCHICQWCKVSTLFYQEDAYVWDSPVETPGERTLKHIWEHQNCPICRITLGAFHGSNVVNGPELAPIYSVVRNVGMLALHERHPWDNTKVELARPLCQIWFTDQNTTRRYSPITSEIEWMPGDSFVVHLLHDELDPSLNWKERATRSHGHARLVTNHIPSALVRDWLQHCEQQHGTHGSDNTSIHDVQKRGDDFIRLVDMETNQIVEASTDYRYLALSYVWGKIEFTTLGQANHAKLSELNGLSSIGIPQSILDAMTLCKLLGERYLWVDSFCIIQDSEEDKILQISRMRSIYQKAVMTVANVSRFNDSAHSPLPGVRSGTRLPFQEVHPFDDKKMVVSRCYPQSWTKQRSQWATRAWTVQEEILSARILYISDTHCWLQCPDGCYFSEDLFLESVIDAGREDVYLWSATLQSRNPQQMCISTWRHHTVDKPRVPKTIADVFELIEAYTRRCLTLQSDTLKAIGGLLAGACTLDYGTNTTYHCGLPVVAFDYALCWIEDEHDPSKRRHGFPSWSWAGWEGAVKFPMGQPRFSAVGHYSPAMSICTNAVLEPSAMAIDIRTPGDDEWDHHDDSAFERKSVSNRSFEEVTAIYGIRVSPKAVRRMDNHTLRPPLEGDDQSLVFYTTYAKLRVDAVPTVVYKDSKYFNFDNLYILRAPTDEQMELGAIRLNKRWRDSQPRILDLDFIVIRCTPYEKFEPFWHSSEHPIVSEALEPPDWSVFLLCITWIECEKISGGTRKAERVTMAMVDRKNNRKDAPKIPSVKDWMSVQPKPIEVLVELV